MSAKSRVQLTDNDRKVICELAKSHVGLTQDKLTKLAAQQLNKPDLGRSTVTGTLTNGSRLHIALQAKQSSIEDHSMPR